jgi:hypothetical protein
MKIFYGAVENKVFTGNGPPAMPPARPGWDKFPVTKNLPGHFAHKVDQTSPNSRSKKVYSVLP